MKRYLINTPTPKGLNVKRSNERSEIIAPGGTWGSYKTGSYFVTIPDKNQGA